MVQGDIPVTGIQLACVSCHRRSGFGASEGNIQTPPITGDVLFSPVTSRASEIYRLRKKDEKTRPAYDDKSLARAISGGLNPADRGLNPLMPRYQLTKKEMAALISYLRSMTFAKSPGVTATVMHLATIVSQDVDKKKKKAMLDVLNEYIKTRNTDTRPRTRRREHAPWNKTWQYEGHRTWELHVWELKGAEKTWRSQLEKKIAKEPVFAIINGIVKGSWRPVHEFCEQQEMPCLFPNTNLPLVVSDNFYNIYFSKGLTLEAEVLAKHLKEQEKKSKTINIVQIYKDDGAGQVPAKSFREKMQSYGFTKLTDVKLAKSGEINKNIIKEAEVLIIWLDNQDLAKAYKKIM